jgi:hypothetical protein
VRHFFSNLIFHSYRLSSCPYSRTSTRPTPLQSYC